MQCCRFSLGPSGSPLFFLNSSEEIENKLRKIKATCSAEIIIDVTKYGIESKYRSFIIKLIVKCGFKKMTQYK